MRRFVIIWIGQLISTIGSGLTGFALAVWMYLETGQAAPFVYTALFNSLPVVMFSLFAGALVDRWNRRRVMILTDVGAAFTTFVVFLLYTSGRLEVWHIYVSSFLASLFATFQLPAFNASITMLVPKEQLTRANGMVQTGASVEGLLAPVLAGLLVGVIGVGGMILIDFLTFFIAVGTLLAIGIPQPVVGEANRAQSLLADIRQGWKFLYERSGLTALAGYIGVVNVLSTSVLALITPLILSFSNPRILGLTQMISSLGLLLGGILISSWGGTKRKMTGIYIGVLIAGIGLMFGGLRPTFWWIAIGIFLFLFPIPTVNAQLRSIIQVKSPLELQGRVFSVVFMIARLGPPLGFLISAPLADRVFDPRMSPGGSLVPIFGPLFGVGTGRGIGLMMSLAGVGFWLVTALMYAYPRLRLVEDELPDAVVDSSKEDDRQKRIPMKDIVARVIADPRYLKNIEYGRPRSGHPEGKVKYHIAELEAKLEKLAARVSEDQYWKLIFLIHVHDTFKADAVPDSPISSPHSHASLARRFAAEFIDDADLLNMVQYHDVNFSLWKQFSATGAYDTGRFQILLDAIVDWDLFLLFLILDGGTNGKDPEKIRWFLREVREHKFTMIDEGWMGISE